VCNLVQTITQFVRLPAVLLTLILILAPQPAMAQGPAMTLEHKVAQMFMLTLHGSVMTEEGADILRTWQPGAVVLFAANLGDPSQVTRLTNAYQQTITDAGGLPLLIAVDQEGGVVARLTNGFTVFPTPMLTAAAGIDMARQVGARTADELRAVGINMNLAPVADLITYRDNPIVYRRSWGSNPQLASEAIAAYVQGSQAQGVLATAKHFPGHGETRQDSHAVLQTLEISRDRLETVELTPFRAAIAADVAAIMVAHIHYRALQPEGVSPASLSRAVVTDLLREEMGYTGLVMTDALDMNAVDITFDFREAAVRAVEAGVDILALGPSFGGPSQIQAMQAVVDAVRSGRISETRIDESVARILATKRRFGLLNWQALEPTTAAARVDAQAGTALIEALFRAGVAVAWDRSGRLPVQPDQAVAIVFPGNRWQIVSVCEPYRAGIRWVSTNDSPTPEEIAWAVEAAGRADTIIVFTQDAIFDPAQQALVHALPPAQTVVVALMSPFDAQAFPQVGAFMATYSPQRPAVPAVCPILFGAAPASGRWMLDLP
jgi:beta-N-acetylhexosaminidase